MFKFSVMEEFRKLKSSIKLVLCSGEQVLKELKEIKMTQAEIKAVLVAVKDSQVTTASAITNVAGDLTVLLDKINNPSTENTMDAESLAILTSISEAAVTLAEAATAAAAVVPDPIVVEDPTL